MILITILKQTIEQLVQHWRNWKLLTFRKILYLPHTLSPRDRLILASLLIVAIASGLGFFVRMYTTFTVVVPARGGSYTEGILKEPRTINPLYALSDVDRDLTRLVFSSILTYEQGGAPQPDLAETYELGEDGKSYTVKLRDNARWHDGEELDADDVVFTIKAIQNPQYKSPLRANWQGVGVEKLDRFTIRFTLRAPYAPFLENFTVGILPEHLWGRLPAEQVSFHKLNVEPVGSGPYRFSRMKQTDDGTFLWYQLSHNPQYYREGPYLETITLRFFHTEEELVAAWRKGDIEGFGPVTPRRVPEHERTGSRIYNFPIPRIFGLFFNQRSAPFLAEKKMREAIAYAINREELIGTVSGGAISHDYPLPRHEGFSEQLRYPHDPERARKILEELGWKDNDGDGIREKSAKKKGGEIETTPLQFTLTTSDWPDLLKAAERIQEMAKTAGIQLIIAKKSFPDFETEVLRARNFEILLFGQVYGHEVDPFSFWHSSQIKDPGLNVALYTNKKADELLERARVARDPALRQRALDEFAEILKEDLPVLFLFSQLYLYLLPEDIKGVSLTSLSLPSDRFNTIRHWYRATRRVLP